MKKPLKPLSKKKGDNDEDDIEDEQEKEDEWEKVEDEENWDPDFDEFDIPRSKTPKPTGTPKKSSEEGDEDLKVDDDFKEFELFNDSGFEDDDDDF